MLIAMALSLLFTFTYATLAAKSKQAERLLVPMLDILQSVPILGFISFTVVFFMALVPGRVLGAEFAAIFAIFTSQAWNMAFSFYQSLRTVPTDLDEAARRFRLSPWKRFWRLDVPFAMPQLIWNMMMSMSGGWFFVVASEAISVGNTTVTLPGIGSYIALAIEQQQSGGGRLGDRHDADRDPDLRPDAVPAAGRLGGPVPLRAGGRRRCRRDPGCSTCCARSRLVDRLTEPVRRAVAAFAAGAPARRAEAGQAGAAASRRLGRVPVDGVIVVGAGRGRARGRSSRFVTAGHHAAPTSARRCCSA